VKNTTFENLNNFYTNIYKPTEVMNESFDGGRSYYTWTHDIIRKHIGFARQPQSLSQLLDSYGMTPYNDDSSQEIKDKYGNYVYVDIPAKVLPKLKGLQQYGAGYPGVVLGYNLEKHTVLVFFNVLLPNGKNVNVYNDKFIKTIGNDSVAFDKRYSYDITRIKTILRPLGVVFRTKRTMVSGTKLLSEGIKTSMQITLDIGSYNFRAGEDQISDIQFAITPGIINIGDEENGRDVHNVKLNRLTDESLKFELIKAIDIYNDRVKELIPLKSAMDQITQACRYRLLSTEVKKEESGGMHIILDLSVGYKYNSFKSFGLMVDRDNPYLDIRRAIPPTLALPAADKLNISLYPQQDKATGKKFLLVKYTSSSGNMTQLVGELYDKGSPLEIVINSMINMVEEIPEDTKETIEKYNNLTEDGKLMFFKYLVRKYAER